MPYDLTGYRGVFTPTNEYQTPLIWGSASRSAYGLVTSRKMHAATLVQIVAKPELAKTFCIQGIPESGVLSGHRWRYDMSGNRGLKVGNTKRPMHTVKQVLDHGIGWIRHGQSYR